MEKLAIISDIHGNLEALKAVLYDIKERGIDKVICLGDIIAKGTNQHQCIELIKNNCNVVLQGNCDEYFTRDIDLSNKSKQDIKRITWNKNKLTKEDVEYLRGLPYCFEFYMSGRLVRLFHSTPEKIDGYVGRYMSENEVLIKTHEDGKQWIHTGDVGYIREDHNLVIVDRIKRVFNRNGFKVYPNAIENKATECPFIQDCVVIPRFSIDVGEANVPVMYVVLKGEYKDKIEEVIEYCKQNITGVSSIYDFIFLDEMPRTSAGKKAFKYIQTIDAIHYPAAGSESYEVSYSKIKKITLKQMKEIEAHE